MDYTEFNFPSHHNVIKIMSKAIQGLGSHCNIPYWCKHVTPHLKMKCGLLSPISIAFQFHIMEYDTYFNIAFLSSCRWYWWIHGIIHWSQCYDIIWAFWCYPPYTGTENISVLRKPLRKEFCYTSMCWHQHYLFKCIYKQVLSFLMKVISFDINN